MKLAIFTCVAAVALGAQPLTIRDTEGAVQRPLAVEAGKLAALFFITTDCPISNYYAAEIRRICTREAGRVQCYLVYSDPGLTQAEIAKHRLDMGYGAYPAIFDSAHVLVKRLSATVTPEVALVGPGGQTLYQGRIDDSYASLGKRRLVITDRNLESAIAAALAGKPIENPRTHATGCSITPVELLQEIRKP